MTRKKPTTDTKYRLSPINLENPSNAHDFLILLTGTNKKVLELGPASGYLSKILRDVGCRITGIEIDPVLAKQAEQFLDKIIVGDIEELNLKEVLGTEKYDVILIGDFLEHIKNPNILLQNLHDFLSEDGYLVCSIPNIAHGSIRIKLLNGEFRYRSTGLLANTHLRFFTLDSILSMLQTCGYSMTELKRVKEDIFGADGADLKPYTIPQELIESILRDPESTTFQYVFRAIPKQDNKTSLESLQDFPTNITTEELKNRINVEGYKEHIQILQRTNLENQKTTEENVNKINQLVKDIGTLQSANLKNQKIIEEISAQILQKDSQILQKDSQITTLQAALTDSQRMLEEIHQSFTWRMLKKYDNTIGKFIHIKKNLVHKPDTTTTLVNNEQQIDSYLLEGPLTKKDLICFPITNWHFRFQRPQHILQKFAENGHRIFYFTVDTSPMSKPYEIEVITKNIYLVKLHSDKPFNIYKDKLDTSSITSIVKSISALQNDLKIDAVSIVMFPSWEPVVFELKKLFGTKIIFDCMDEFAAFSNVSKERKTEEELLMKNSELVIATSSYLLQKASKIASKTVYIPNAGEFEHFNKSESGNVLKGYKKPIIGYFGSIAEWFDAELIEYLAKKRPDLSFIFIGYTFGSNLSKLEKFKNVHFLGERPYSELPKYLHSFDICLIPFKNSPLIDATHPVKIYEYLSAGKPVVAAKMVELSSLESLCYVAENREDFLTKIDLALKENSPDLINKRIEFASKNTWQHRFDTLYSEINKIPSLNFLHHD